MTTEQIGAVFAGLVLLLMAIVNSGILIQIKDLIKRNDLKTDDIKSLVDGHHGVTLEKLAEVREELAGVSGRKVDDIKAVSARQDADEHEAVNKVVETKTGE